MAMKNIEGSSISTINHINEQIETRFISQCKYGVFDGEWIQTLILQ